MVTYNRSRDTMKIEMKTFHKWIAFGQKPKDGKDHMVFHLFIDLP